MSDVISTEYPPSPVSSLVDSILQEAKKQGATEAEVDIGFHKGFTVTGRARALETVEYHRDKLIEITVYFGKRMGMSSLSDMRPEAIQSAVSAACHIARFTDEDPCSGLPEKNVLAFQYPKLELTFPWSITVDQAIDLALQCEAKALAKDKRIMHSEGATVSTMEVSRLYANTCGFLGTYSMTRHDISCALIAKHHDEMQRDYYYTVASDAKDLLSIDDVANQAVERTLRRLQGRRLTTRQAPVIFAAEEARGLLGHFLSAISGGSLYRKSSFLLDTLGSQIFPAHITLQEKPHVAKGLGSAPFDDDGVLTRPNIFVENGIIKNYVLSVYSARKLKMQTTANAGGTHNLFITTGNNNLSALLKKMHTGLLVTELMGQGVNLITGDYSRGAAGFWVENGEIQYPVEEITIAGNLREMYSHIVEVGNDIDTRGNIHTGSILIDNMMIAGD